MSTIHQDELLFHVDGATEGLTQWRAETFQLVNWGGFQGPVRFTFSPGATLISGASGTGKSTLLDAYIALMMPSDTSFNGASNDAVAGRARSSDQRNLISYLRGQTDTTADGDGQQSAKVLRGSRTATWGAIGMTFVDDHGRRFTAFRAYYVPARARSAGDLTMRMATHGGAIDLAELDAHLGSGDQHFAPRTLKAAFPGLKTHDSYATFATALHTRLGIGANGDGAKALRLLVRIQSGQQIRTVDELYKDMVLERPATYDAADRAIEHFDDLEAAYQAMLTEQEKASALAPITTMHEQLQAARAEVEAIDTFGLTRGGDTPVALWSSRTESALLEVAVDANRGARELSAAEAHTAREEVGGLDRRLRAAQEEHRRNGGGELERLAEELEDQRRERDERRRRLAALVARTTALEAPLGSPQDFDRLRAQARTFLAALTTTSADLTSREQVLMGQQFPLLQRRQALREDKASFAGRAGRVPRHLDAMRHEVATAAGMGVDELPFLAELIDVAPEHARWRAAVETVLGGSARLLLVPRDRLTRFSAAIDPLRLRGRLEFEGVPSAPHVVVRGDPDCIAGKLLTKDHPFSTWVQQHVGDPARNALCVEAAVDLDGPGYRVTLAGQTRRGSRGSHGRSDTASVIGFSSAEVIADIDVQLADVDRQLMELDALLAGVRSEQGRLDVVRRAYEAVEDATWPDIDVPGVESRIAEMERARAAILDADDTLKALAAQIDELEKQVDRAQALRFGVESRLEELEREHTSLVDRQDRVTDELIRFDREQRVLLDDQQSARLDADFAAAADPGDPRSLSLFPQHLGHLRKRLIAAVESARLDVTRTEAELGRVFQSYQHRWPDADLGSAAASYPDYAGILETILATGLHTRREEWRRRLTTWSGQDLVPLNGAMGAAIEDIEDRLVPINDILATLPFGAGRDRLRIRLRRLAPEHVAQFRRDLRQLAQTATKGLDDAQLERRFAQLQQFMALIRRRDDPRATGDLSDRDRLLDVRRHVEITAERHGDDGELLSVHSSLGGKSGGESQELVAFIVGAALRFRLGDELRTRPRFAPVFLDEGFVKSDAEFTGRAVQAWKGLGFQLIIGAPLDKVTALEPHMDDFLAITKDTATGYAFVDRLRDRPMTTGPA